MFSIFTGFVAGSLHVVSGPDHLMAVAPFALERRAAALRVGFIWGLGHGLGVLILGGLGLWARQWMDLHLWSDTAEFLVGFVLIGLGVWAIVRGSRTVVHTHGHAHSAEPHNHIHAHIGVADHAADHKRRGHTHGVWAVGLLHGIAGTGHLFGVLPALALPMSEALGYLLAYLFSAIVSMTCFAGLLGLLTRRLGEGAMRWIGGASGVAAIGVGVFWIFG
jgi:hypothetical protein